jgi:hypothetical protein
MKYLALLALPISLGLTLFASDENIPPPGSPEERKLIEAAFNLDEAAVRQLVAGGTNVNVPNMDMEITTMNMFSRILGHLDGQWLRAIGTP